MPAMPDLLRRRFDIASRRRFIRLEDRATAALRAVRPQAQKALPAALGHLLTGDAREHIFTLPAGDGQRIAWLHAHGQVLSDAPAGDEDDPQRRLHVRLTPRELGRYSRI